MALLQELPSGKLLELPSGKLAEECCCEPCGEYALSISVDPQSCCCFAFSFELDPTGATIVSQEWDFGDGATSTDANPTHCYEEAGTYLVSVTTTDAEGCVKVAQAEVSCDPCPEGEGPAADFSYQQTDECCFTFTDESTVGEECEGREIVAHRWLRDGVEFSTGASPTACFDGAGPWDVTHEVEDNFGCTDAVVMAVTCEEYEACADNDCGYPVVSSTFTTLAGFSDIPGAPACPECSDLNGLVIESRNVSGNDPCFWTCAYGTNGRCLPCGEGGPTLCAGLPDNPAPGFPGNHPTQIGVTVRVSEVGGLYDITVIATVETCRLAGGTYAQMTRQVTWKLTGLTTCPHGSYSVPFFQLNLPAASHVCEHDATSPVTVVIP